MFHNPECDYGRFGYDRQFYSYYAADLQTQQEECPGCRAEILRDECVAPFFWRDKNYSLIFSLRGLAYSSRYNCPFVVTGKLRGRKCAIWRRGAQQEVQHTKFIAVRTT